MTNTRLEREARQSVDNTSDYINTLINEIEELEKKVASVEIERDDLQSKLDNIEIEY